MLIDIRRFADDKYRTDKSDENKSRAYKPSVLPASRRLDNPSIKGLC
jgi:hypothetical protein